MTALDAAGARPAAPPRVDARAYRLSDIDMVRGLAIALMAIDHARDYLLAGTVQVWLDGRNTPLAYLTGAAVKALALEANDSRVFVLLANGDFLRLQICIPHDASATSHL